MSRPYSIRRRLVLQLAAIAALLSLAFFFAVRGVAEGAASDTQDNILAASATSIADALYTDAGAVRLELPYSALSMLGTISQDRVYYRVNVDGATLTGYDDLPVVVGVQTRDYRGEEVRIVSLTRRLSVGDSAREVTVSVAQTRLGLAAISRQITGTATAIGVAFFLVAVGLSLWAAQNAIAPLDRLAGSIARRGPNDLRAVETDAPVELAPLVGGLNSFMMRLRAALTRSEDLITEAAHRVRTPLATVRTQAEVIHRTVSKPENRKALRDMIRAVDESSRSAGQLLDHAMVTLRSDQLETQRIDMVGLVREVADRLSTTAELRDIQIDLQTDATQMDVRGDPILLENAVRNILDNAIKYSPEETTIHIEMTAGDMHQLAVTDQGRGFPTGEGATLTRRFSRGTNVGDVVGSGLGLTIVNDVAEAHGGRITLSDNAKGSGACVTFYLPSC